MPSVVGLLEQHELAARRRVDGLREEADRIHAELAVAEQEWQEWAIARKRSMRCWVRTMAPPPTRRSPRIRGMRTSSRRPGMRRSRSRRCRCGARG